MRNHPTRSGTRRVLAATTAIIAAAGGLILGALPAAAAPANVPTAPGSLTIHKYEQPSPAGASNNSGEPLSSIPAGWNALENVNFTYQRINVDLTDSAGWDAVTGYVTTPSTAPLTGAVATVTTGADGSANISAIPVGAYLVTEIESPNALRGGQPVTITSRAAPFVVTVPVPTGAGTWNSNVHVYPKNSVTTVSKVPGLPGSPGVGATIPWTISVEVPRLPSNELYSDFRVTDTLDAKLAFGQTSSVTLAGAPIGYTVNSGGTVEWVITDLASLNAAQGGTLKIDFSTTVLRSGAIENTADIYMNDPTKSGTPVRTPVATTYWGPVQIFKHVAGDQSKTLAGAEFAVFASQADAAAGGTAGRIVVSRDSAGAPIPAQTIFTTGADGTVLIPGLFAGNSTDTAPISRTYYVREVKAPAGYQLDTTPIAVTVTADGVTTPIVVTVPNAQLPPLMLPLTGGSGSLALTLGGLALIAVALGFAARSVARRRSQE